MIEQKDLCDAAFFAHTVLRLVKDGDKCLINKLGQK
jgi:hypothetical protein